MAGRWRTTTRGVETRHAGVATTTGKLVEELGQRGFSGCSMKGRVDDGRKRVHGRRSTLDARYASTFGLPHRLRSGGFATHLSRVVLTLAVAALAYVACPQATLADAVGVVRAQRDKLVAIVLTSFVASCCSAPPNRSPTPAPIGIVRYRHRSKYHYGVPERTLTFVELTQLLERLSSERAGGKTIEEVTETQVRLLLARIGAFTDMLRGAKPDEAARLVSRMLLSDLAAVAAHFRGRANTMRVPLAKALADLHVLRYESADSERR